jgi:predicted metal-dependent phosphoesterase TrpH
VIGVEVSSYNGHILALGVSEPIPRGLSADETIRRINEQGGLAIASHPGRFYTGLSVHEVRAASFQAVEVANGHSTVRQNRTAYRLALDIGAGMTGGSDAHWPDEIGTCRTVFPKKPTSPEELLDAIRDHDTEAVGHGMSMADQTRLNTAMLGRWVRRGGKRI